MKEPALSQTKEGMARDGTSEHVAAAATFCLPEVHPCMIVFLCTTTPDRPTCLPAVPKEAENEAHRNETSTQPDRESTQVSFVYTEGQPLPRFLSLSCFLSLSTREPLTGGSRG